MSNRIKDAKEMYPFLIRLDLESKEGRASKRKALATTLRHTDVDLISVDRVWISRPKLFLPSYVDLIFPLLGPAFDLNHNFDDEMEDPKIYTPLRKNHPWHLTEGWGLIDRNKNLYDAHIHSLMAQSLKEAAKYASKSRDKRGSEIALRKTLKEIDYENPNFTKMLQFDMFEKFGNVEPIRKLTKI